jgi:hypothetical protein
MKRGNGKKRVLKEIAVSIILSMALCGCNFSAKEPSEQNPTETVTESSTPEVDKNSADLRKEELPFEGMESMTCQEYDEDNILGLSAIYVNEQMLVFCFQRTDIWRGYEANHSQIDVIGLDEKGYPTDISYHVMAESQHFFWIQIKQGDEGKAAGFGLSGHSIAYSVYGLTRTQLTAQKGIEGEVIVIEKQVYENNRWGEPVNSEVGPKHVPN